MLQDYRMTKLTFGVNTSSFIANISVKRNARDHAMEYPLASKVVEESFYVDDGLTGADSVKEAVKLVATPATESIWQGRFSPS